MKRYMVQWIVAFLLLTNPVMAAEATIGIVNTQKILGDCKAAVSMRDQLKAKQKVFQAEFDAREKALRAEEKSLRAEKDALVKAGAAASKEAFQQKLIAFEKKMVKAQKDIQEKNEKVAKVINTTTREIEEHLLPIAKEVAAEKKLTIMLDSSVVLYNDSALDVTDEIMKRLNDKLSSVKVNL